MAMTEIAKMLHSNFASQGFRPTLWTAPYFAIWILSFFDPKMKAALTSIVSERVILNEAARSVLLNAPPGDAGRVQGERGVFVRADVALVDMAESLIALNCV